MVCAAVWAFGGVRTPSLARPTLESAYDAFVIGYKLEAAIRLREALRRHLAAECASHNLDQEGDAATLLERLSSSGVALPFVSDLLTKCDQVIALECRADCLAVPFEVAYGLIGSDFPRDGGAL